MTLKLETPKFQVPRLMDADRLPLGLGEPNQAAVRLIQQALIDLAVHTMPITTKNGTELPDGKYGMETLAAVKEFQKNQSFPIKEQEGIVGKKTMLELDFAVKHSGPPTPPVPPPAPVVLIRDLFIFFSGVSLSNDPSQGDPIAPSAANIAADVDVLKPAPGRAKVTVLAFNGALFTTKGINSAAEKIKKTRDPAGKLIIYGFSAGGMNAIQLCRALPTSQPVTLLLTVDPSIKAPMNPTVDRSLPANVEKSMNRYQTNPSLSGAYGGPTRGGKNPPENFDVTKQIEEVVLKPTFGIRADCHGKMEEFSKLSIMSRIKSELGTPDTK